MAQSKLLQGTMVLSIAIFFTKFLGLIFIIPFAALVGEKGIALYGYAYTPYTIILSVATLGVPRAVSKFVSKYNALGDYRTGRRLLHSGILVMLLTGVFAFFILFLLAPEIAPLVVDGHSASGNKPEDVIFVIRLVSTALIIVPVMSVIRGYFQGFQSMGPTAMSQMVEQIVRIAFILLGAVAVLYVFGGSTATAVGLATFAAFIGALGGLAVLIWYWKKRKPYLDEQIRKSKPSPGLPLSSMYQELLNYAVPFVLVGLALPLFQLVDQLTINQTLMGLGYEQAYAENVFANINQLSYKLLMIPVSLSTALAITIVPTITDSFTAGNIRKMHGQITQAFQIVLFLTIPAAIGLSLLGYSVYGTLYGVEHVALGGKILRWFAPTALLFALFSVTSSILQGLNRQKLAVFSLLVGLLLKLSLNEWMIRLYEDIGAILATNIGFICAVGFNVIVIRAAARYRLTFISKRALLILIFSALMAVIVWLVTWPFRGGDPIPHSYIRALVTTVIGVAVGGGCYFWLAVKSNLAAQIFGDRFAFLRKGK